MVIQMKIGNRKFDVQGKTYLMGILNITPDSFSDGGKYNRMDEALRHVGQMIEEGMDLLDIGGESTRPGYELLDEQVEIERVVPIIEKVKSEYNIPVSLDTYKAAVAQAGIEAGIDLINDIWGLRYDGQMAPVIARSGLPCCLMHNRREAVYQDFIQETAADLGYSLHLASEAGIPEDKIILDPGIGFGKTYEQNLEMLNSLEQLHMFGCPLLLGTSRKSVIGLTLDTPVTERLEGTLVTTVIAVMKGCTFVRVHDILANKRAIQMAEAIRNHGHY